MKSLLLWIALSAATPSAGAAPAAAVFESGVQRTVMIELYTSEGCNSCPPAEHLLNGFVAHERLWTRYVPLAFHVDYWDSLGWRDRYARPRNAARQRRYAALQRLRAVYTPAFVVNGRAWRPRVFAGEPNADTMSVGNLRVERAGARIRATFAPTVPMPGRLVLNVAVLGMGLSTEVAAGENEGRRLHHEFVVLSRRRSTSAGPGGYTWRLRLPETPNLGAERLALAAWVSTPRDPTPLQATGGYLD